MRTTESVFKRGKIWWIRYSVGGRQERESAKTTRKEEAIALLHKRQNEIFEGRFFADRKANELTMDGLRRMWLSAKARKKTIKHDEQRFERIVAYFGRTQLVSTVRSEDIDSRSRCLGSGRALASRWHRQR